MDKAMNPEKRVLFKFHGGVHPPQHKVESCQKPISVPPLPPRLVVPLHQSVGNAAKACVSIGERVLKGQRIGEAEGTLSAAVHAPTSGVVIDISEQLVAHPSGLPDLCVIIDTDGQDEWISREPLDLEAATAQELRSYLRDMGVVGLGGAVFPSHLKLSGTRDVALETLVINGAECEPYITCDDRLMRERATDIVAGIDLMCRLMQPQEVLIGIEDNKPEALAAMREAVAGRRGADGTRIEVVAVPTIYPGGGAKQLIRVLTGKEVATGVRSTDLGVQCFNVATAYTIERALRHAEPVLSRIVTLTGNVARPGNVEALLGTPASFLLDYAGMATDTDRVVMGGPMMGIALPGREAGITKAANCLIAGSAEVFPPKGPALPCIRCGKCAEACPADLQPQDLFWFAKSKQFGRAQEWALFDCIECGCCSYVCPSEIPLVDYYRYAKSEIWAAEREKKSANNARERHEFRLFRIEREKEEKAARLAAKAAAAKPPVSDKAAGDTATKAPADDAEKQARIKAAMERAAAQRAANTPQNTEAASPDIAAKMAEQDALAGRIKDAATGTASIAVATSVDANAASAPAAADVPPLSAAATRAAPLLEEPAPAAASNDPIAAHDAVSPETGSTKGESA